MWRAHVCRCRTRLNIVDGNCARCEINGSSSYQSGEGSFGHAVDACPRKGGADGSVTADQDDPSAILHILRGRLYADKCRSDINVQHAIEVFEAVAADGPPNQDSGIVDENIQFAQLFCGSINCC